MLQNIEWHRIALKDISPPPLDLIEEADLLCPSDYVINRTELGKRHHPSLTPEAAHYLLHLHPPLLWGSKHHCIGGLRVLTLTSPFLQPEELLPVGILPAKTSRSELITLMEMDCFLAQMAYGVHAPEKSLYVRSRELQSQERLTKWSPALATDITTLAELLGVSRQTLYVYNSELKKR